MALERYMKMYLSFLFEIFIVFLKISIDITVIRPSSLPIEAMNPTMVLNMLYTQDINI